MSLSLALFFIFSIFQNVFCENSSKVLLKKFPRTFNLSDNCGNYTILKPESYFDNGNWSEINSKNRYLTSLKRKCENFFVTFALISQNTCKILDKNSFDIDDDCFKKFIDKKCANMTLLNYENVIKLCKESFTFGGKENSQGKRYKRQIFKCATHSLLGADKSVLISEQSPENEFEQRSSTTELSALENSERTKRKSTEFTSTKGRKTTEVTVTEETKSTEFTAEDETKSTSTRRTEQTVTQETETTKTSHQTPYLNTSQKVTETTKIFKSTSDQFSTTPLLKASCELNEYFFENHCYFLRVYEAPTDFGTGLSRESDSVASINFTSLCSTQHPDALGVAVETKKENQFILQTLKQIYFLKQTKILTSGIKTDNFESIWLGWNQKVDHAVLNFGKVYSNSKYYIIDPCKGNWQLWNGSNGDERLLIMCERLYNPKNVVEEFYKQCLESYRNSPCYDKNKHAKYCCTRDEKGYVWFACPNQILHKSYHYRIHCVWECKPDGHFSSFHPICDGNISCSANHHDITYRAPITTYAISSCPENFIGNSIWYCGPEKTFIGLPDYSLCCEDAAICRDTDIFLNFWMGCPSKKIVKKTACPPGSDLNEAYVEWYCHSNGSFNGTTPDYSNCNRSDKRKCSKKDRYGVQWVVDLGTTMYKDCPPSFVGQCWWKCTESGEFDGDEPDCTWCRAKWMDAIDEKIKGNSHHEEVITAMEEYTRKEDLRIGYGHLLDLTSDCVSLYKKQNIEGQGTLHYKFLRNYSKLFKNLAGSPTLWASFSISSRKIYAKNVIEITQNAAFANLEVENEPSESYNATFADLKNDGFDFFLAYDSSIKGFKFPLQNSSESDWHLEIKEINESNSNFAAMGLVMNYSLSLLMFPQGEETKDREMNAPALTFVVAFSRNRKAIVDHNVRVFVSFKHTNRTRFPEFVEIKRRLHKGEKPSGVFNSTICYYYSDSIWTSDRCSVTYTSNERTECMCTHLSTIGLLMTIHKYVPDKTLEIISIASSGITILSLILALLVFYFFDSVRNDRALIGKNLCFCLLAGHLMLITVLDKRFFYISDEFCKIYAVILHYIFMAAFAWMFVEGCHLYRMLVLVFDSNIEYRYAYLLTGYGVPLVVVGATYLIGFAFQEQPYGQDELCWLKYPNYVWAFIGPVTIITSVFYDIGCVFLCISFYILIIYKNFIQNFIWCNRSLQRVRINFYILIVAMKLAISSRTRTEHSNFTSFKLWLKGWFTLSSLLGITWFFGLFLSSYNTFVIYGFVVFNGLQGFFIFLFRCVLNEQYKDVFFKRIKSLSSTFSAKYKNENGIKSETKVVAITGSKSLSSSEISGLLGGNRKFTPNVEKPEVDMNVKITLKPAVSEAYLRNRMIAQNFAARRSKATWVTEFNKSR